MERLAEGVSGTSPRELGVGTMVGALAAASAADFGEMGLPAGMVIAKSARPAGFEFGWSGRGSLD